MEMKLKFEISNEKLIQWAMEKGIAPSDLSNDDLMNYIHDKIQVDAFYTKDKTAISFNAVVKITMN